MVSSPSAPAPGPTAAQQTQSNQQTALYQAGLNDVNQNTPLGSISYNINPNASSDNQGNPLPSTSSNITLNPGVQNALTQNIATTGQEAGIAGQYLNQVQNTFNTPYNLNSVGTAPTPDANFQKNIMDTQTALQQPYVDRSNEQLQASLAAQGITNGSQAYNNSMMDQNNSLNNLQEQNTLNATQQEQSQFGMQQQAYQQQLQNYQNQYTMPLNEFSALQSGSQVAQPQFSQPSQTGVNPTNVASIYQNAYNQNAANANSQNQGLFGLAGSGLTAAALFA